MSREKDIVEGVKRKEPGTMVYYALACIVNALCSFVESVSIFIPGVIHLLTVYPWAKYNRIDLGTADKLAVTVLAIYQLDRMGIQKTLKTFLLLKLGYGYNALIYVKNDIIRWSLGGASFSTEMLSARPLDLEVVAAGNLWRHSDVFYGGVLWSCNTLDTVEAFRKAMKGSDRCYDAYKAMVQQIATIVTGVSKMFNVDLLLLSGRLTAYEEFVNDLISRLLNNLRIEILESLGGARITKHAVHGYALLVEGLLGGSSREIVEKMRIADAYGTALDYVYHSRLEEACKRIRRAYLESVKRPRLCI